MNDIVDRLRDVAGFIQKEHGRVAAAACLATEAADLIQSLREKTQYWPDNAERDAVIRHQKEDIERLRAVLHDINMTTRCDKTAVKARAALNPAKG